MKRPRELSEIIPAAHSRSTATGDGRLRTRWIIRSKSVLRSHSRLTELARIVEADVYKLITDAYQSGIPRERLKKTRPSVSLVRLDDWHLIVTITFAGPDREVGDTGMISEWGTLRCLERELGIADLN